MSEFLLDENDDDRAYDADRPSGTKRPVWVTASVVLSALMCLSLLPAALVMLFPPFAVYFLELARLMTWVSPLLLAGIAASLWWGFPRKRPVVTAMSMLGLVILLGGVATDVVATGGKDPVVILGIAFGPFGG